MSDNSPHSLADTLESLGIEDLKERLEISPLLAGAGSEGVHADAPETCCCCKILPEPEDAPPPEDFDSE